VAQNKQIIGEENEESTRKFRYFSTEFSTGKGMEYSLTEDNWFLG